MTEPSSKILYVDDERVNLVLFEHTFKRHFDVVCVASPEAALERSTTESFAVIVSDQRMPQMSGLELLTKMRELYPRTIRIILTAYADNPDIVQALESGLIAHYLLKPWKAEEVQEVLAKSLVAFAGDSTRP